MCLTRRSACVAGPIDALIDFFSPPWYPVDSCMPPTVAEIWFMECYAAKMGWADTPADASAGVHYAFCSRIEFWGARLRRDVLFWAKDGFTNARIDMVDWMAKLGAPVNDSCRHVG